MTAPGLALRRAALLRASTVYHSFESRTVELWVLFGMVEFDRLTVLLASSSWDVVAAPGLGVAVWWSAVLSLHGRCELLCRKVFCWWVWVSRVLSVATAGFLEGDCG